MVGAQDLAHPRLVVGDDVGGQGPAEGEELVVAHDVVDQAPRQRLLGVDVVAGGAHLPGPANADGLGQHDGQPPAGHDPDPGVGVGEPGLVGGDEEVTAQGHFQPTGHGDAVHGADEGLGVGRERALPGLDHGPDGVVGVALATSGGLLEVDAGAERRVGPGEDDHVDPVVGLGLEEVAGQQAEDLGVQGVAGLGPVDGDRGDPVGHGVEDGIAAGGVQLSRRLLRAGSPGSGRPGARGSRRSIPPWRRSPRRGRSRPPGSCCRAGRGPRS